MSAAWIVATPGPVWAQSRARPPSQSGLEARVKSLEEALVAVQAELAAARAEAAQRKASDDAARAAASAADAKLVTLDKAAADASAKVSAMEKKVAAVPAEGFKVGNATVKMGGFVKAEALASDFKDGTVPTGNLLRDFYLPSAIPVGNAPSAGEVTNAHAKQTRLSMTVTSPVDGHKLSAYVEGDFQTAQGTQGSQRTTNGYNFALRRAYVTFDDWQFGQDWSTFQVVSALPESTDFIGPTEGTVFVRQPQVRYTRKLSDIAQLQLALENPETGTATTASAALVENDVDSLPDVVGRLNFKPKFGEFTLAAVGRQLAVDNGTLSDETLGWGLTVAGKAPFGAEKRSDIRFMLTHGEGIGRYVGLNFAPDAIVRTVGGRLDLEPVGVTAGFVAVRVGWTAKTRSTFTYSLQTVDNTTGLSNASSNDEAWSAAVNLFTSPVKGLDLGVEYRHAERELFNGQSGELDRVHAVVKQSF